MFESAIQFYRQKAAAPTHTLARFLSGEVIHLILAHLVPPDLRSDYRQELSRASMISQAWRPEAQRLLNQYVHLSTEEQGLKWMCIGGVYPVHSLWLSGGEGAMVKDTAMRIMRLLEGHAVNTLHLDGFSDFPMEFFELPVVQNLYRLSIRSSFSKVGMGEVEGMEVEGMEDKEEDDNEEDNEGKAVFNRLGWLTVSSYFLNARRSGPATRLYVLIPPTLQGLTVTSSFPLELLPSLASSNLRELTYYRAQVELLRVLAALPASLEKLSLRIQYHVQTISVLGNIRRHIEHLPLAQSRDGGFNKLHLTMAESCDEFTQLQTLARERGISVTYSVGL